MTQAETYDKISQYAKELKLPYITRFSKEALPEANKKNKLHNCRQRDPCFESGIVFGYQPEHAV